MGGASAKMTSTPQISARLTEAQSAALEAALAASGLNNAEFIRQALAKLCEAHGVTFPGGFREWTPQQTNDPAQ